MFKWSVLGDKGLKGAVTWIAGYAATMLATHQQALVDWVTLAVGSAVAAVIVGATNWLKNRNLDEDE